MSDPQDSRDTMEVQCTACGQTLAVDRASLPKAGGTIPCIDCGGMIAVGAPIAEAPPSDPVEVETPETAEELRAPIPLSAAADEDGPSIEPGTATSPLPTMSPAGGAAASAAAIASPAPAAAAAPDDLPEEVVCPRCSLHFRPRREHAEAAAAIERKRVLIVEDKDYFLEVARDALADRFEIVATGTTREALSLLDRGGFDALVAGVSLDGRSPGLDLLHVLTDKPCPIILFADGDESEAFGGKWEEFRTLGADDLVPKGMNTGENLARRLSDLLGLEPIED